MAAPRVLLIAGNGFIGSRTAVRLVDEGCSVLVHHCGARPLPVASAMTDIKVERSDPPITRFPSACINYGADVVIHFLCMGAEDAAAFVAAFDGKARRLILISSCDVYRAYGRFTRLEPGPPDPTPITEQSPLRRHLYPYRATASEGELNHWYEKLDAERAMTTAAKSEVVILRLPKVYGPGRNERLDTVYAFAAQPNWRWTHGHVDNVAAAIACAARHELAANETFNIGERDTPSMGERLARLPPRELASHKPLNYDFAQDLVFDSAKIRERLGYRDALDEADAMTAVAHRPVQS